MRRLRFTLYPMFVAAIVAACSSDQGSTPAPSGAAGTPAAQAGAAAGGGAAAGASGQPSAALDAGATPARDAAAGAAGAASQAPAAGAAGTGAGSAAPMPMDAGSTPAQPDATPGEPPATTPMVTCPATPMAAGNANGSVMFGGHSRTYLLHVGRGYTGDKPVPLVFDFHGYGQAVSSQERASGFADLADEHGFVVVYPAGVGGSWHVNGCCGQAAAEMLDEIGAVREVLKDIQTKVCVDPKRIYASGISQGGGMAHHVGCLAADIFAAVAPVSSDLRTDPCQPSRPISEVSFRGTADALSAYEGGPVGPAGMQYQSIGAKPTLEKWKTINKCEGAPEVVDELCETYKKCEGGVEVSLCTIPGGGHALYTNPESFSLAGFAWKMFERQSLP